MNNVSTLSIDLAKNVFQLLSFDKQGNKCFSRRLDRAKLLQTLTQLPACNVVMGSCSTSHYWRRYCLQAGHQVQLIPAQHVTPFVRGNKNDKDDCMAIYEASLRPNIRFVPVKTEHQQAILALHRYRERLIHNRTACINQTCGLLLEFGIVTQKSLKSFRTTIADLLNCNLHGALNLLLRDVYEEMQKLDANIKNVEAQFKQFNEQSQAAQIIQSIPGIGIINALAERRGKNKALVATAHRLARLMWILLQRNEPYKAQYTQSEAQSRLKLWLSKSSVVTRASSPSGCL